MTEATAGGSLVSECITFKLFLIFSLHDYKKGGQNNRNTHQYDAAQFNTPSNHCLKNKHS